MIIWGTKRTVRFSSQDLPFPLFSIDAERSDKNARITMNIKLHYLT